jgi:hypothetical protein
MTGFHKSASSYHNTTDAITGQGVLQGSSSAAPIYILYSDVFLSTYMTLGCEASFIHPISCAEIHDKTVQYIDNTSQFLNPMGAKMTYDPHDKPMAHFLTNIATKNSTIWSKCMWISGGCLNSSKCYYYDFLPEIDLKKNEYITQKSPTYPPSQ